MNWHRVEGNWHQLKGRVKQQWGNLTEHPVVQIEGRRECLIGLMQERYGVERDHAAREVQRLGVKA